MHILPSMLVSIGIILALATRVSADMAPPFNFYASLYGAKTALLTIVLINFPVNLFWLSFLLLVLTLAFRMSGASFHFLQSMLVPRILAAAAVLTLLGALVDLCFLYGLSDDGSRYELTFSWGKWFAASIVIFALTASLSWGMVGALTRVSLMTAGMMTALNLGLWYALSYTHPDTGAVMLFVLASGVLSPFVLVAVHLRMPVRSASKA